MKDERLQEGYLDAVDTQISERDGAPCAHPEFDALVRIIWRLRQEDGCPWDKVQTHASITRNMIEEAYEAVEAINQNDNEHIREELGDVLEQVLLHSQIADDGGCLGAKGAAFDIDDVCRDLREKLIRRHPHIFSAAPSCLRPNSADEVLDIWDKVKAKERADAKKTEADKQDGLLDSIPFALPALMQSQKIAKRTSKTALHVFSQKELSARAHELLSEIEAEQKADQKADGDISSKYGELLFLIVSMGYAHGVEAEEALNSFNAGLRELWAKAESFAKTVYQKRAEELSQEEMSHIFSEVKADTR